uniref:Uncharacterized protein n=2 Tax=Cajanus cajan TaxID=3821 RepID=A0A151QTG3_CAJCA|nr:hypothetical protein KK1_045586 [Cajanus cajan]
MLKDAQSPLWDGCDKYSILSASLRALTLKTDYGLFEGCLNEWMQFMGDIMPDDNRLLKNIYQAKKTVAKLGLGSMKIDCCPSGCMLYYKENEMLQNCKVCQRQRYKRFTRRGKDKVVPLKSMWYFPLVPRLKRLYSSMQTAHEMKWHHTHQREPSSLSHPSDAEAWRHFDETWPDFAQEPRNVRLGLCADGFAPFDKTGRTYSCWPKNYIYNIYIILLPFIL